MPYCMLKQPPENPPRPRKPRPVEVHQGQVQQFVRIHCLHLAIRQPPIQARERQRRSHLGLHVDEPVPGPVPPSVPGPVIPSVPVVVVVVHVGDVVVPIFVHRGFGGQFPRARRWTTKVSTNFLSHSQMKFLHSLKSSYP